MFPFTWQMASIVRLVRARAASEISAGVDVPIDTSSMPTAARAFAVPSRLKTEFDSPGLKSVPTRRARA